MKVLLESQNSIQRDTLRFRIICVLWGFFLAIAPLWYSLIRVYRAPIPFDSINDLTNFNVKVGLKVALAFGNGVEADIPEIQRGVDQVFSSTSQVIGYGVNILDAKDVEQSHFKDQPGQYLFNVNCQTIGKLVKIHADRTVDIQTGNCDRDAVSQSVIATIAAIFGHEYKSMSTKYRIAGSFESDSIRVLKYAAEYQLVFSLLVANPNDAVVRWDIEESINSYMMPFLNKVSNITTFKVTSQIQNYVALSDDPQSVNRNGKKVHEMHPKVLSHYFNSAGWNLASVVSSAPQVNFVLYVPSKAHSPMQIVHSDESPLATNAFLIPQWGGVKIQNLDFTEKQVVFTKKTLKEVMQVYTEQLRILLGVLPIKPGRLTKLLPGTEVEIENDGKGLTLWELDGLLRTRAIQNMMDTISTLQSFSRLLNSLDTIPVQDHISKTVLEALELLNQSKLAIESVDYNKASLDAQQSVVNAEKAFFDPTMVSLLYFPAEHLLAIYMPFFVPILVPMISTTFKEYKSWKSYTKVKTE